MRVSWSVVIAILVIGGVLGIIVENMINVLTRACM